MSIQKFIPFAVFTIILLAIMTFAMELVHAGGLDSTPNHCIYNQIVTPLISLSMIAVNIIAIAAAASICITIRHQDQRYFTAANLLSIICIVIYTCGITFYLIQLSSPYYQKRIYICEHWAPTYGFSRSLWVHTCLLIVTESIIDGLLIIWIICALFCKDRIMGNYIYNFSSGIFNF